LGDNFWKIPLAKGENPIVSPFGKGGIEGDFEICFKQPKMAQPSREYFKVIIIFHSIGVKYYQNSLVGRVCCCNLVLIRVEKLSIKIFFLHAGILCATNTFSIRSNPKGFGNRAGDATVP